MLMLLENTLGSICSLSMLYLQDLMTAELGTCKLPFNLYWYLEPSFAKSLDLNPDFSGLAIGGVNYIYETCSSLFSGSLNKHYTGDALNNKLSWLEYVPLINSMGLYEVLDNADSEPNLDVENYVLNSLLLDLPSSALRGVSNEILTPTLLVLENPELIDFNAAESVTHHRLFNLSCTS